MGRFFLLMEEKVQNFNTITLCGMGEPMFYSRIYDVVHALRDKQIVIITSGTILIDFAKLNKYRNVKMISFSVDAANEEEMKNIATRYNWENLINNLKPTRPIIKIINCTVGEHNYKILPEIARFAVKHKLVAISFTMAYLNEDKEKKDVHKLVQPYLEEAKKSIVKAGGVAYTDSFSAAKCIYIDSIIPFINIDGDVFFPVVEESIVDNLLAISIMKPLINYGKGIYIKRLRRGVYVKMTVGCMRIGLLEKEIVSN